MRDREQAGTRRRRLGAGRQNRCWSCGLDQAGRGWLGRSRDETRQRRRGPARLDPAAGSQRDDRRASRRHGGEELEWIALDGAGGRPVARSVIEGLAPAAHAVHRLRAAMVAFDQAERAAHRRRLGYEERGQYGESEPTRAESGEHRRRVIGQVRIVTGPAAPVRPPRPPGAPPHASRPLGRRHDRTGPATRARAG